MFHGIIPLLLASSLAFTSFIPTPHQPIEGGWQSVPEISVNLIDGHAWGKDGCNSFSGRYKKTRHGIMFSQLVSTRMLCQWKVGNKNIAIMNEWLDNDGSMRVTTSGSTLNVHSKKHPGSVLKFVRVASPDVTRTLYQRAHNYA